MISIGWPVLLLGLQIFFDLFRLKSMQVPAFIVLAIYILGFGAIFVYGMAAAETLLHRDTTLSQQTISWLHFLYSTVSYQLAKLVTKNARRKELGSRPLAQDTVLLSYAGVLPLAATIYIFLILITIGMV